MDRFDLIRNEAGDVLGVTAIDQETGKIAVFQAKATLFATGGAWSCLPCINQRLYQHW